MTASAPGNGPNKLRGIPFVGPIDEDLLCMGDIYYVDSGSGSDGGSGQRGKDPSTPFATLNYAVQQCANDNGDMIIILPGHAENVASANAINCNVNGLKIVGVGNGRLRPTFTFTATTATFNIGAGNTTLRNLYFDCSGVDKCDKPLTIRSSDAKLKHCHFFAGNATNSANNCVRVYPTADRVVVEDCKFQGTSDAANTVNLLYIDGGNEHIIRRNFFSCNATDTLGVIQNTGNASKDILVEDNVVINTLANANKTMIFHASTTGMIRKNNIGAVYNSLATGGITAANCYTSMNYWVKAFGVAANSVLL